MPHFKWLSNRTMHKKVQTVETVQVVQAVEGMAEWVMYHIEQTSV